MTFPTTRRYPRTLKEAFKEENYLTIESYPKPPVAKLGGFYCLMLVLSMLAIAVIFKSC